MIVGAHLDRQIQSWLFGDASLRTMKPLEQSGERTRYTIPELQLQLQVPRGAIRPYLGAGAGWFIGQDGRGTASGALGLRVVARTKPFGARAELRVRGIGRSFGGSTAEWTGGATLRF
jgi:hypothetical protein